ncbi:thiamine-phosphate pyrophosphorylase [Thermoplasmatales archaeon BRNA1]|nr:thiamine-phosphate pyrophosphorylase [Thermoplasmatales archaeon BRNA1]
MFELYAITDREMLGKTTEAEAARLCYEGGADIVQLRMKDADGGEMLRVAKEMQAVADEYSKFFIVNDRVDIAILSSADGVHLGQSDIPLKEARRLCGEEMIIGISCDNAEQARQAVEDGADYVAIGSIFTTGTKKDAKQGVGLDAIMDVRNAIEDAVPIVAIGGINRGNILDVLAAGADCPAVVSAIMAQPDIRAAAHELKAMVLNYNRTRKN